MNLFKNKPNLKTTTIIIFIGTIGKDLSEISKTYKLVFLCKHHLNVQSCSQINADQFH